MASHALTQFADEVWLDAEPVRIVGTHLTATMAVVRLRESRLLLYSPLPMSPARRSAVEALGLISDLYAPNLYHHLSLASWASAFPSARVHAPARLGKKRRDLRIDRVHGSASEPLVAEVLDEVVIDGFRLDEAALFHRHTRTLIVADLVHNIGAPQDRWTKCYTRAMGFYDRVALSRMIRWTAFADRAAARRSLDALLALPFDNLIVGHGGPLQGGARAALAAAYAWLPAAAPSSAEDT